VAPGEGQEDTRARAAMPSQDNLRRIVDKFAGPKTRLLVTGYDRSARPTVEVAHEALIRTWPRLRGWIDANRDKLRARAAILQDKTEWEQQGRRSDLLLPAGFPLERARALLAEPGDLATDDIQEFVALSAKRERAERRRKYLGLVLGLAGLAVSAGVFGYFEADRAHQIEQREGELSQLIDRVTVGRTEPEGLEAMKKVCLEAVEVANTLAMTTDRRDWRAKRQRFLELYYGPMNLVELWQQADRGLMSPGGGPIEMAMVRFRLKVDAVKGEDLSLPHADALCPLADEIRTACTKYLELSDPPKCAAR
jgi:hypothetical protein